MKERDGCLTAILALFGLRLARPAAEIDLPYRQRDDFLSAAEIDLPYRQRDDFLSAAEFSFYRVLHKAVGDQAVVLCKVNLTDIFFIIRPNENQTYRNKINRKHVDFLLCNPATMQPRLGIELDDASHNRKDRQLRDDFVDDVFAAAGLPLLRFAAKAGYSPRDIAAEVIPRLQPRDKQPPVTRPNEAGPPICPKCRAPMVLRTATKGTLIGQQFYGCPNYPKCRETASQ